MILRSILVLACATMGLGAFAETRSVVDYGAAGDGEKDCTAAFQRALDEAGSRGGGIVTVPAGRYRIDGNLSIPGGVTLQGTFRFAPSDQREARPNLDGSVLVAYAGRGNVKDKPFITLAGSMATLEGFMITYGEWKASDVPPVPYPPTVFVGEVVNAAILNCCFLNSYEAIHCERAGRFLIRNVTGFPTWRGLYIDYCLDIGRVENVHFWPFGSYWTGDGALDRWIGLNATAFEFGRYDWCYVLNTFCFGYGVGYRFTKSTQPDAGSGRTNGSLIGIGADSCERCIVVEGTQNPGIQIVNAELVGRWGSETAVCIEVLPEAEQALINLSNSTFWGPIERCIWTRSPNTHLIATGCTFTNWDIAGAGMPAIDLEAGKAIIQGNSFMRGGLQVRVGEGVKSAILMGNQAPRGLRVENRAGERTQLVANEADPVVWTDEAKTHYRIAVGSEGDDPHLEGWHAGERAGEWPDRRGTKRWTAREAALVLPVAPNRAYTLTMEMFVPAHAISPDDGLFLDGARIAEFPDAAGPATLTASIPPGPRETLKLELRTKGWVPKELEPESSDGRTLGIAVRSLTLKAEGADDKVFDANNGGWLP
jgi:hypothetical protein